MHLLSFLVIIKTIATYEWLPYNDKFDCIVSIAIDMNPVSIGVFISAKTILTSANPLNDIGEAKQRVNILYVNGYYNVSKSTNVESIANNQSFRKKYWVPMGIEATKHTCIHDLALITITDESLIITNFTKMRPMLPKEMEDEGRKPYFVNLPKPASYVLPMELVFAGFGYIDEEHVKNNTILEVSTTSDSLTDCDEWIPREWGRFICFLDNQNLYSLASGAPLFDDKNMKTIYGIGSFTLKKGKDNLLVFTDLRPYVSNLYGYN